MRAPSRLTWSGNVAEFEVESAVGPVPFLVEFKRKRITHPDYGSVEGFDVGFMRAKDKGAPWQYKTTDDAGINPFHVFGGVLEAVAQFLKTKKPNLMWFVADEPGRARLYNRLLKRMRSPGYSTEISGDGKYTIVNDEFRERQLLEVGEYSPRKQEQRTLDKAEKILLGLAHDWVEEAIQYDWDEGDFSEDLLQSEVEGLPYVKSLVIRDSHKGRRFELTYDGERVEFET